jgi:signal transduction histidine kinase
MQGPSSIVSSGDRRTRIDSPEPPSTRFAESIKSLRQELHDGLSQQVVGVAMMAHHLADNLNTTESPLAGKAQQLAAAMEDTKRQTFAIAERLKQIEADLNS